MSNDPFVKHAHGYATGTPTPGPGGMPDPHSMAGVHQREAEQRRRAQSKADAKARQAAGAAGNANPAPGTATGGVDLHYLRQVDLAKGNLHRELKTLRAFENRHAFFIQNPERTRQLLRWNPVYHGGFLSPSDIVDRKTGKVPDAYREWINRHHKDALWPVNPGRVRPYYLSMPADLLKDLAAAYARIDKLEKPPFSRVFWPYHALGYAHDLALRRKFAATDRLKRIKTWTKLALIACWASGAGIVALAVPILRGFAQ